MKGSERPLLISGFPGTACLVVLGVVLSGNALAEPVPGLLDLQGNLRTENGIPLNRTAWLKVSLYDAEFDGTELYAEDLPLVPVVGGRFAVQIGQQVSLPPGLFTSPTGVWVGISVDGEPELPRQRLVSVPYAMQSEHAAVAATAVTASALTCSGCVDSVNLATGSVGSSQLASGTVLAEHMGAPCSEGQILKRLPGGWACSADEDTRYAAGPGLAFIDGTTLGLDADHASGAAFDGRFVNEGQSGGVTAGMIAPGAVSFSNLAQGGCTQDQVVKWNGSTWACGVDASVTEAQVENYVTNDVTQGYLPRRNGTKFENSPIYATSSSGYVGIGTASPAAGLHVSKDTQNVYAAIIDNTNGPSGPGLQVKVWDNDWSDTRILDLVRDAGATAESVFWVKQPGTTYIKGSLGVGTTSPAASLDVNGVFQAGATTKYDLVGTVSGALTPRCSCDTGTGKECPDSFRSSMESGDTCYDQRTFWGTSSYQYTRASVIVTGKTDFTGNLVVREGSLTITGNGASNGIALYGSWIGDHNDSVLHVRSGGSTVAFDGSDDVGIGTTTPASRLDVADGDMRVWGNYKVMNSDATVSGAEMGFRNSYGFESAKDFHIINNEGLGGIAFHVSPGGDWAVIEPMLITSSGRIGIGTTSPSSTLSVNGDADKPGGGSWGTYSDARLKDIGSDFTTGLDAVRNLQPVHYRYRENNAQGIVDPRDHVGLVAQEVRRVLPEAVTENDRGFLVLDNDPILWALVNAVKEQADENSRLRAENEDLKARVRRIEESLGLFQPTNSQADPP